jgi:hypothetical protein
MTQPLEHVSFDKPDEVRGARTGGWSWSTWLAVPRSAGSPFSRAGGGPATSSQWPVAGTQLCMRRTSSTRSVAGSTWS